MKKLPILLTIFLLLAFVLPTVFPASAQEKRVEVDLTRQRLYAFSGETKVFDFVISSDKPWWPTPTSAIP